MPVPLMKVVVVAVSQNEIGTIDRKSQSGPSLRQKN
jgi:hypothetical protein